MTHRNTILIALCVSALLIGGSLLYRSTAHTGWQARGGSVLDLTPPPGEREGEVAGSPGEHLSDPSTFDSYWSTLIDDRLPFSLPYPSRFEILRWEGTPSGYEYDPGTTTTSVAVRGTRGYYILLGTPGEEFPLQITVYPKRDYPTAEAWYEKYRAEFEREGAGDDRAVPQEYVVSLNTQPVRMLGTDGLRVQSMQANGYLTRECVAFLLKEELFVICGEGAVLTMHDTDEGTQRTLLDLMLSSAHPTPAHSETRATDAWARNETVHGTHPITGTEYWVEQENLPQYFWTPLEQSTRELEPLYRERLVVREKNGATYVAHDHPASRPSPGTITKVLFSPDGRFLFFSVRYYEAEGAFYTDLSSRKTVELTGLAYATRAETDDSPLALYWSLDGSRMALQSYGSAIGYGNNALYVSPTGHPKDLVPIFTFNETPVIDGTNQPVVKAINDLLVTRETVTFTAFFSAGGSTRFVYTFATNALEKQDRAR